MAHFLTLVLVPADDPDPAGRAEHLMDPYCDPDGEDDPGGRTTCDSFVVGGRYDGIIWGREQHHGLTPAQFQRRYGLDVVRAEDNVRPVSRLVPDVTPYALVTPDGAWLERGAQAAADWQARVRAVLDGHLDHLAVAVDCHC